MKFTSSRSLNIFKSRTPLSDEEGVVPQLNRPKKQALHPRIVEALSPTSGLYGALWPTIIAQASWVERKRTFSTVNIYFASLCKEFRRSDRAKWEYVTKFSNASKRGPNIPLVLSDPCDTKEWFSWSGVACGFHSIDVFREFCALANIDPQSGVRWKGLAKVPMYDHGERGATEKSRPVLCDVTDHDTWIWMSPSKDVVFETFLNPLQETEWFGDRQYAYCHQVGVTGDADKVVRMYNFMHDRGTRSGQRQTVWMQLVGARVFM